jgi:DEAD/DEAH box helicase domain-containing protein
VSLTVPVAIPAPDAPELLRRLLRGRTDLVTHVERVPARPGRTAAWPRWVPDPLRSALSRAGIAAPWRHQVEAAEAAWGGEHVIISTGTASGKSLAYLLPILSRLLADSRATALYISATKALAADQARAIAELGLADIVVNAYDGDTPHTEREWIRGNARLVLTNPDMLSRSILPGHEHWARFLRRLSFVVIDECHTYRGVFGSHVAQVLRRLRRVAARYGDSGPVFVLASATVGEPAITGGRLTGLPVRAVSDDDSPRGDVTFALWQPPLIDLPAAEDGLLADPGAPRRSVLTETAQLLADAVANGARTLAFVRSRRGVEIVATAARGALAEAVPELTGRVAAYRSGYLRDDRRRLERDLQDGTLLGLATTSALELGIDVAGVDSVVLAGYPGTRASLWQQAGRAGRDGRGSLCVLIARDDPLDTYLVHHPEALFGQPVEATVLDPDNPYVLASHLCCAAAELPLREEDVDLFGGANAADVLAALVSAGTLRRRPTGWYWTGHGRPDVDLRGSGGDPVEVVESATGRLLGTVDSGSAHAQVHDGAVYLHRGESYVVDRLDLADSVALVRAESPDWSTHPLDLTSLAVLAVRSYVDAGPVGLFLGEVEVTGQVVGYQRRRLGSRELISTHPLDLPPRALRTVAVWWTVSPGALADGGVTRAGTPGALHAAEHAAIGLLPLVATCDRWDIGGLSTALHADTGTPTVFVYDGHYGGAGFAERGFGAIHDWLSATRTAIARCGCEAGCPACVYSPKCGNGNEPLHKAGAVASLDVVLTALGAAGRR